MGGIAAIGGMLLGARAGKQAAAPQQTSQSSSTTTQSSGPWEGAQPALATLYNGAMNQFNQGAPQYYPGQTVADQSWATQHGLNVGQGLGTWSTAYNGGVEALDAAQRQNQVTTNGGWLNSDPSRLNATNNANFNAMGMAGMGNLAGLGAGFGIGSTAGMGGLNAIGNGALLNGNPYLDQTFNNAAERVGQQYSKNVMPQIASMFGGAGRYGSEAMNNAMGTAQNNFGDQINRLATDVYGGNYNMERNLMQQALNQQSNVGSQERNQQLQALGLLTGNQLQGQNVQLQNNQLLSNQFQNERNRMMQSMGMAPAMQQADWDNVTNLLGIGGIRDQYSQALIDANKERWDYGQNAGWDNLARLQSIMQGAPQQSTMTSTSQSTGTNPGNPMAPMQGAMMGGMMGNAIGGMFR